MRGILRVRVVKARKAHSCVDGGCVIAPGDLHVCVTTSPNHEFGRMDGKWDAARWCGTHGKRLVNEELVDRLISDSIRSMVPRDNE